MNRLLHRRAASRPLIKVAAAASIIALTLAACGSDDDGDDTAAPNGEDETPAGEEWNPDVEAEVTISYDNFPPAENAETRADAERVADEFMELYPNVTLEGEETVWDPQSFNAMVAGGTLATVVRIPLTEPQRIIRLGQAADITDAVAENEVLSSLNPDLLANATGEDGRIYGLPTGGYALGLAYNRDLFEQAGLDPDAPPQTWDEVRSAAKAITDTTGEPGFVMLTTGGQGGWMLNALTYAFGGLTQVPDGDSYTVTASNDGTLQALDILRAMRWEDESMGSNFLIDQSQTRDEFAGGRVGMFIGGAEYFDLVANRGFPAEHYGLTGMPQGDDGIGALTGGTVEIIRPDASPEEIYWGTKWIEYRQFRTRTDQELAVANAQAQAAEGRPVGNPRLPLFDQETEDQYLEWVDEYINVNLDNFAGYSSAMETLPLVPEPPAKAQEFYAALDPVVQAVLTEEDADVGPMLEQVEADINSVIAQDN